jgi:hypothetical protein
VLLAACSTQRSSANGSRRTFFNGLLALDSLGRVHVAYFAGDACMYATNAWPPGR